MKETREDDREFYREPKYYSDRGFLRENNNDSYRWEVANNRCEYIRTTPLATFTLFTRDKGILFCKNEIELLVDKMQEFLDRYEELDEDG